MPEYGRMRTHLPAAVVNDHKGKLCAGYMWQFKVPAHVHVWRLTGRGARARVTFEHLENPTYLLGAGLLAVGVGPAS